MHVLTVQCHTYTGTYGTVAYLYMHIVHTVQCHNFTCTLYMYIVNTLRCRTYTDTYSTVTYLLIQVHSTNTTVYAYTGKYSTLSYPRM